MIIAVDTGGTKTLIASFDAGGNKTILAKFPTPPDYNSYQNQLQQALLPCFDSAEAIVVGFPGEVRDGVLLYAQNLNWQDIPVRSQLAALFPNTVILVANDAALAGLGEANVDTAVLISLYITLSTGVGGTVTVGGKLTTMPFFEPGSMLLPYNSQLQTWEDIASGSSFYQQHGKLGSEIEDTNVWKDFASRVAYGLAILIPLLSPDRVIIGGSMGTHFQKYSSFLIDELTKKIPEHLQNTHVTQAKHPEEAVIYGCYYHAKNILADK